MKKVKKAKEYCLNYLSLKWKKQTRVWFKKWDGPPGLSRFLYLIVCGLVLPLLVTGQLSPRLSLFVLVDVEPCPIGEIRVKELCKLHQLVDIVVFQETAPTAIGIYPAFSVYVCLAFLTKNFYDGPISGVCHLCEFKWAVANSKLVIYANINKLE